MNKFMELAMECAKKTMNENIGGPFGALVEKDGEVIAVSSNRVLGDLDPTAHAEISAIRKACKELKTYDLSGCNLYTTCYPCPMCMSALIWANIKNIYVGCLPKDAENIGFRDDYIYKFIKGDMDNNNLLKVNYCDREDCLKLFEEYNKKNKTIY